MDKTKSLDCFNGYNYVDFGLPSGTLWASSVIKNKLGEPLYFQWGDIEGWTAEQIKNGEKVFCSSYYKFGEYPFTKYNSEDGKRVLDLEDDAAHVHMGGDWHMPTKEQLEELSSNTTSKWTTKNGVNGRLFTSMINGKSIFVPTFGCAYNSSLYNVDDVSCVLSSSVSNYEFGFAWYLYFNSSYVYMGDYNRSFGRCILGVVG